jgi:hypothetical protein
VKFQTFRTDALVVASAAKAGYQQQTTGEGSQSDMLRALELPFEAFTELKRHCDEIKIDFLSTAFDAESLDFVASLQPICLKWPSGEIDNRPLLGQAKRTGLPVLLSTGMGTLAEIEAALGWLGEARSLFPQETFERMQVEAVGRYGLTELLGDRETVEAMEPSRELATALLQLRGKLDPSAADGVRRVIERVVEDVVRRLRPRFLTAMGGRVDRSRRSMHRVARNFDWKRTLRANLGRVDGDGRMLVQDVRFNARQKRALTWDVIVLVDQSGSMAASLLYSAVCAGILSGLPGIDVRLVLFDTSVVDMSHLAHDPVSVLLTAQLGGGTDIARAVRFAEGQVRDPSRTVVALVSDFYEGGSISELLAAVEAAWSDIKMKVKESGATTDCPRSACHVVSATRPA